MSAFPGEPPEHIDGQLPLSDSGQVERIVYAKRDKDSNWTTWEDELGQPDNAAGRAFAYTLGEVGLACRIDLDTGNVIVYGVEDGNEIVPLAREIKGN